MVREKTTGRVSGGLVGLVGGVISGLAYLFLPVATVPMVGSARAWDLVSGAPEVGSLALLPFVPWVALAAIGFGLWLIVGKPAGGGRRLGAIAFLACAGLICVAYLWPFMRLQDELAGAGASSYGITATTFTGIGFWLAVIGAIVIAAGTVVELTGSRVRASA